MSDPVPPERYFITTWGCQMNAHESERVAGLLERQGLVRAADPAEADLLLLNTCAIRGNAVQKVFSELGELRRMKEEHPNRVLGVLGCVAQQEGEELFRRAPHLDLVVGPRALESLPRLLQQVRTTRHLMDLEHYAESVLYNHEPIVREDPQRAYLTVIEGCNKTCAYCIVPFTRGREVSRPLDRILAEVRALVGRGYVEFELLGQNVNAWRQGSLDFADLLAAVDAVEGVRRIRFTTSHPLHFSARIIAAMRDLPRVCDYLHLPPQSGSDSVLRRMRRGYTRAFYLDRVRSLRAAVPGVRLSGDIIVGFPGESDGDFEETLSLLDEARFDSLFSFAYSPRPHTAAAAFEDPLDAEVQQIRLHRLQALQRRIQEESNRRHIGRLYEVRVEGKSPRDGRLCGRTSHNLLVHMDGPEAAIGAFVRARITASGIQALSGRVVDTPATPHPCA